MKEQLTELLKKGVVDTDAVNKLLAQLNASEPPAPVAEAPKKRPAPSKPPASDSEDDVDVDALLLQAKKAKLDS